MIGRAALLAPLAARLCRSGAAQMWHAESLFVDDAATCSNSSLAGRRLLPRTRVGELIPILRIDIPNPRARRATSLADASGSNIECPGPVDPTLDRNQNVRHDSPGKRFPIPLLCVVGRGVRVVEGAGLENR